LSQGALQSPEPETKNKTKNLCWQ